MIYQNLIEVTEKRINNSKRLVIAIDGRCGSGKSTIANKIATYFKCPIVKMDDFFLQPFQRTIERLNEAGGNIDYERFYKEVIIPIKDNLSFSYRKFDCSKMILSEDISIPYSNILIIEGTYSHHPIFTSYADIKVFVNIPYAIQIERIIKRNGKEKAKVFEDKWIPMEEKYFSTFKIREKSNIIIENIEE